MVSVVGTWMQNTALPLLIIKTVPEKPGLWLGINHFLPLVPLLSLGIFGGSLADRYPKRTLIVLMQIVLMLQAFVLTALSWNGGVELWQILALTLVSGAAAAI